MMTNRGLKREKRQAPRELTYEGVKQSYLFLQVMEKSFSAGYEREGSEIALR